MVAPTAMLAAKNNAISTIAGAVDGATDPVTFSVAAGGGALFPAPATDGPFNVTIDSEILKCTSRTVDSLTCARAQEGTSIAVHSLGAAIQLRVTAKQITDIQTLLRGLGRFSLGPSGLLVPTDGTTLDAAGLLSTHAVVGTPSRVISADGVSIDFLSGATIGNDAGINTVGLITRTDLSPVFAGRIYIPTATSVRGFLGLTDQAGVTMVDADNPAGNYAGLAFNTVPSANWRFVRKDGTTQTFNDTSQAISAAPRFFLMEAAAGSITFSLYDAAYALLANVTVTTLLPLSTAGLRAVAALETLVAAGRTIGIYSVAIGNHIGRVTVL